MEPLGPLLRRLREERRWTQTELAGRAGFSLDVIAKVEQGRDNWSTRAARAVFEALAEKDPLSESEAHDFMVQSKLTESQGGRLFSDVYLDLINKGRIRPPGEPRIPAVDQAPDRIARLLKDALDRLGPDRVEMLLRTVVSIAEAAPPPAPVNPADPIPILQHEVIGTPTRRPDGHIEQIIEQTRVVPSPAHPTPSLPSGKLPRPHTGA